MSRSCRCLSHEALNWLSRGCPGPALRVQQRRDSLPNVVTDLSDTLDGFAFGIFQGPVLSAQAWYDRARFAAAHGHE